MVNTASFERWKKKNNVPLASYDTYEYYNSETYQVKKYSALSRITLNVVDSTRKLVLDADVKLYFSFFEKPGNDVFGKTDEHGVFSGEAKAQWDVVWNVSKEGHYNSSENYVIQKGVPDRYVVNGCWYPWNPTINVTLKEIINPIKQPMIKNLFLSQEDKQHGLILMWETQLLHTAKERGVT